MTSNVHRHQVNAQVRWSYITPQHSQYKPKVTFFVCLVKDDDQPVQAHRSFQGTFTVNLPEAYPLQSQRPTASKVFDGETLTLVSTRFKVFAVAGTECTEVRLLTAGSSP